MKRKIYTELLEWKNSDARKPLIISGARQVGKTWIMNEFGKREYSNVIYANFDNDNRLRNLFEQDYDINRILLTLQALIGVKAEPGKTLIILDEIQEVPKGLGSLKYFCENAPEYHVMVAGSLLGIALHPGTSFPVGKVDMIDIHPMDFEEFLWASGNELLVDVLKSRDFSVINSISSKYIELLRLYYFVGGMPEAVDSFFRLRDLKKVRKIQNNILSAYKDDISKHAPKHEVQRINMVMDSIPSQLAKENKKFIFGAIKKGARANDFEIAIQWLIDCGIVHKVSRVSDVKLPLKFYEDLNAFKLFFVDCGLLGALSQAPADQIIVGNNIFSEYKGMFTEQFVHQQLVSRNDLFIYYWSSEKREFELDFVVQKESRLIPVEVKAEGNVHARSLRNFMQKHQELKAVRVSMLDYIDQEWMENWPLFAVGEM
ncbi:MAG: ATP-binding protein [Bacteroidales bacterium]|nr:ATP-binding protein [Bacteroidales bacterium]